MYTKTWKDCYVKWDFPTLCVGNAKIERRFRLQDGMLVTTAMYSHITGYCWTGTDLSEASPVSAEAICQAEPDDNAGLSSQHLAITLSCTDDLDREVIHQVRVYPDLPFVQMSRQVKGIPQIKGLENGDSNDGIENLYTTRNEQNGFPIFDDVCDILPLPHAHLKAERITLFDKTDGYDTLLKSDVQQLYSRQKYRGEGNLIIITDYEKDEALLVVKDAPTHLSSVRHTGADICIDDGVLRVTGTGFDTSMGVDEYTQLYGTIVGIGRAEEIEALYKVFDRVSCLGDSRRHTYVMSNTWGDRHQDSAVCHEFLIREIDIARELGVDIVQIDDGWQRGVTANSVLSVGAWSGYYAADQDFWSVNLTKFPQGLQPIVDYAAQYDIELGLWFAPDSSSDFENWKRDAETLLKLHHTYGIRYFKLDSVNFTTKLGEQNFIRFLRQVRKESGNRISFNLDVTAQNRLGYLYGKEFGTLFVENRYTDWANYYPHNTLKNLWSLTRFIQPRRLQFELLNNRRNAELYGDDQMAPACHGIDYEFACTMMSNPLVWMEMSELMPEDVQTLAGIMAVYREHRAQLWDAQINPIGEQPDGTQFSGFEAICPDGSVYLLLFRESTADNTYTYQLSVPPQAEKLEVLYTNTDPEANSLSTTPDGLTWCCTQPRSFLFAVYR